MKQIVEARQAGSRGEYVPKGPYKPRRGLAEESFFDQVDRRLSRMSFNVGVSFDSEGKVIHEDTCND